MPHTNQRRDYPPVRLTPTGDLDPAAAIQLLTDICDVIVANCHDELTVDLDLVPCMDIVAVHALLLGYITAIEYGTCYRVVNARDQAHHLLETTGVADVLADSDDIGALILAVMTRSHPV